jgi:hypothetical protein
MSRKKFEGEREELQRNLLDGLRTPNNPFYRITERGLVLGKMQIEELPSFAQGQFSQFQVTKQIYDLSVAYFTCLTVPSPVVSSCMLYHLLYGHIDCSQLNPEYGSVQGTSRQQT